MTFCIFKKYSNILGEPNKGFHKLHFLNTAVGDYVTTIIGAMLITYLTDIPLVLTTIFLFILSIILHTLFSVKTSTVKYLGLCK